MKILKKLAVTALIVVFPALSWYYLKTGLEFRKEAQTAMEPKGDLNSLISSRAFTTEYDLKKTCEGQTTIIISRKDESNDKTIQKLYDQFDDAYNFQLVLLNEKELTPLPEFDQSNFHVVPSTIEKGGEIALLDNQGRIRSFHNFEKEAVQDLVTYTALVLPKKPGRDIKHRK